MTVYKTPFHSATPCLLDQESRKEVLERLGSPLAKLIDLFNFERFRSKITECVKTETQKKRLASNVNTPCATGLFKSEELPKASLKDDMKLVRKDVRGRRPHDPVLMFTIIMFGVRYRLSDEELAFRLRDSYSFRVFLSLPEGFNIPRQAIWQYREYFTNGGLCELLALEHIDELMKPTSATKPMRMPMKKANWSFTYTQRRQTSMIRKSLMTFWVTMTTECPSWPTQPIAGDRSWISSKTTACSLWFVKRERRISL